MTSKPRVIKDFEKLDPELQQQIKLAYPWGFEQSLISFYDKEGKKVMALPFETDEKYYMVRMTLDRAQELVEEDDDYDDDGNLKAEIKEDYTTKYGDMEHMTEYMENAAEEEKDPYNNDGDDDDDDDDFDD